jgi:CO/xanthine dehydrogenase Mo-binding subunit
MSQGLIDGTGFHGETSATAQLTRRNFLKLGAGVGAMAGGGLLLGFSVVARGQGKSAMPPSGSVLIGEDQIAAQAGEFAPNAFVRIERSGQVILIIPKVEMGQGVFTSIPMLLAEELEVPLSQVKLEQAPPNDALYADSFLHEQTTGGSTSIRFAWEPMRRAGAVARTLLVSAAATQWKVDPASCHAVNGVVVHAASGRSLAYGQLVDAAAKLSVPLDMAKTVVLKTPDQFTLIGKPTRRLDSAEKLNGVAKFGMDVRLPGMLYAILVHCPVVGGKLANVDDSAAMKVPGVRHVVRLDDAVAVVGDHTWAAKAGAAALKVEWNEGANAGLSTAMLIDDLAKAAQRDGAVARKQGDVVAGFKGAAKRIDAVYQQPFLAHATMEPMNCTAHVRADGCDVWVGTQVPTRVVRAVAKVTGLPAEKITLHNHLVGGGFGRRLEVDGVVPAVLIAQQVKVPVKVIWTREEDVQHDMYRPYYYDRISAGLDAAGKPVAWTHRVVGSSIIARFAPPAFKDGVDRDAVEVASTLPYDLPNQLIDYVRQEPRGVATAFWRGVGPTRSTFVVESFIDELAAEAGIDPVAYRLRLLSKSPRASNVLNVAARLRDGASRCPRARGEACRS